MSGRVDWPGRGPTWLGVPALLVAIVGTLILSDTLDRHAVSRHLLTDGVTSVADSVKMNVYPGRGSPFVGEILIRFRDSRGQLIQGQLSDFKDDDRHGLPDDGRHPAPPGTRYAAPLTIVYDPADPATVLATADAQLWLADQRTPRIGSGMLAGGLAVTVVAMILLTRDARRRGLAWWQWYTDAPTRPDTTHR